MIVTVPEPGRNESSIQVLPHSNFALPDFCSSYYRHGDDRRRIWRHAHAHTPETQSSTLIKVSKCSGTQALPGLARQDWRCMQRHVWAVRYADCAFFVSITPAALLLRLHRHSCMARVANRGRKWPLQRRANCAGLAAGHNPCRLSKLILFPMLTKQPAGNPFLRHDRHVTPFDSVSQSSSFSSVSPQYECHCPGPMHTVLSLNLCIQYGHSTQAWGRAQCIPRFLFQSGFRVWLFNSVHEFVSRETNVPSPQRVNKKHAYSMRPHRKCRYLETRCDGEQCVGVVRGCGYRHTETATDGVGCVRRYLIRTNESRLIIWLRMPKSSTYMQTRWGEPGESDPAAHCNTLQHAGTHWNILQHTATMEEEESEEEESLADTV